MNELERLDAAWDRYLAELASLTEKVRASELSTDATARAEAYNMIQALTANAYMNIVYPDPRSPELIDDYSILVNYCGPTGDFKYCTVLVEKGASYRVWGKRGTVRTIDFQQCDGWWEPDSLDPTQTIGHATFDDSNISVADDDSFSFIFSAEQRSDNWIYKHPQTKAIFVRQIFHDWENEIPAEIHFERIGETATDPATPMASASKIEQAAMSVKNLGRATLDLFPSIVAEVGYNRFREEQWTSVGGQSNQNYFTAAFDFPEDEGLILEISVPDTCIYWSVQLYNVWWQALDFRNHQCSLNGFQAPPDSDGVTRILISKDDIGIANWADTVGHRRGQMIIRCKHRHDIASVELPLLKQVKLDKVVEQLGAASSRTVDAEERQRQIKIRRRHLVQRFGR